MARVEIAAGSASANEAASRRALEILQAHGRHATSFQTLEPGFELHFDSEADAFVAFFDTGSAWVVAGAPIAGGTELANVTRRFVAAARAAKRRVTFFAAERSFVEAMPSLRVLRVGEQPVYRPADWQRTLEGSRSLREQLRRARAKGVRVRLVDSRAVNDEEAPERKAIDELTRRWLGTRQMAPMGFLVKVHLFRHVGERRFFVAERNGRVVGLLALVPIYARRGWFFEDLLRDPLAPNGTTELLIDAAMRQIAKEGAAIATLGLAPLAGPVAMPLMAARRAGRGFYDFEGVEAFKRKLRPHSWEPIFVAYPKSGSALVAIYDSLRAFADGGLTVFGVRTLMRVPSIVVRALALALVPWTLLLASPWADAHFPSRSVQWSWIVFDVVLAASLLSLTRRWRPGLALALALAVSFDAVLTTLEAAWFNWPRLSGAVDALVMAIGISGPTLASVLLWRAVFVRRRWRKHRAAMLHRRASERPPRKH